MSRVAAAEVRVRVRPGARREELPLNDYGWIVARVMAPAHDGRANKALCRLVAKQLRIAPSKVAIVRGARSRGEADPRGWYGSRGSHRRRSGCRTASSGVAQRAARSRSTQEPTRGIGAVPIDEDGWIGVSYGVDPGPRAASGGTLESSPGAGPSIDSMTASLGLAANECRRRSSRSWSSCRTSCSRRRCWRSACSRKSRYGRCRSLE